MSIRFYGKGGSQTGSCPSVSVDETDGSDGCRILG
jgi:hypothetical protein